MAQFYWATVTKIATFVFNMQLWCPQLWWSNFGARWSNFDARQSILAV
jgi:hypothetical protein